MPFCYTFESCDPAQYPSKSGICAQNQFAQTGNMIYYNSNPTQWYRVVLNGFNTCTCVEPFPINDITITNFTSCQEVQRERFSVIDCERGKGKVLEFDAGEITPLNSPCGECPQGYVKVDDVCQKIETVPATLNGNLITVTAGSVSTAYGWGGARFYENIAGRPLPIREDTTPKLVDSTGADLTILSTQTGIWQNNSGSNGRLNSIGVWTSPNVFNEWIGFAHCFTAPTKGTYAIGVGADNQCRVKINGQLVLRMNQPNANQYSFNYWHIIFVNLEAGQNIIEMEGLNISGVASFGAEIYNASYSDMISWTSISQLESARIFTTKDLIGSNFQTGENTGYSCPNGYSLDYCQGGTVPVCTRIDNVPYNDCRYGTVRTEQEPCSCYDVQEKVTSAGMYSTLLAEYPKGCAECEGAKGGCGASERTIAYATKIKLPDPPPPDRGFKDCCYDNLVLAKLDSSKDYENDYNGFYFKKQLDSDTCDFVLKELSTGSDYALNNGTYGVFKDFGEYEEQPNLKTYEVQWKKVLALLGTGLYQIEKQMTVAGIPFSQLSNTFHLEHFTNDTAENTVRIDTVMDGKLVHLDVDFKGTNFRTSVRTKGYFGNRNPKYKEDSLVKRNYDTEQISMSQENEYQYQTGLLPICITEEIYDFILFGNEIFVSDFNRANHSYFFSKFAVELASNKGTKYYKSERHARVNLTFKERIKDKRKLNC